MWHPLPREVAHHSTADRLHVDEAPWPDWAEKTLELLVKFCLEYYFNLYFDMKVKHFIVDSPFHILTSHRILKTQPKKFRDAVTV